MNIIQIEGSPHVKIATRVATCFLMNGKTELTVYEKNLIKQLWRNILKFGTHNLEIYKRHSSRVSLLDKVLEAAFAAIEELVNSSPFHGEYQGFESPWQYYAAIDELIKSPHSHCGDSGFEPQQQYYYLTLKKLKKWTKIK